MIKLKKYIHCPFLTDLYDSAWCCNKLNCQYSSKGFCLLSPVIETFRKIVFAEIEKEMEEEEREEATE